MVKVITYGTYDLLHHGHIRLLERAKALGDYLIVGVTSEDFDTARGKLNVQQSLMERIEGVKKTGLADEIIVEEYEGQKIDDIRAYDVDIFTVGSDWQGKFDYLNEYCKVVYLDRTEGVSSTEVRSNEHKVKLHILGDTEISKKFQKECSFVNGVEVVETVSEADAVYVVSHPSAHYENIKALLLAGKHVLAESPIAVSKAECEELFALAEEKQLILMEGIKTAYSTAYSRLLLLAKSGEIGEVLSVDAVCTSLKEFADKPDFSREWDTMTYWGVTGLLPVFQLLGTNYRQKQMVTRLLDQEQRFDGFTKIDLVFDHAMASVKVGASAKAEGELIIAGTKGYLYVPAPWWKTDYFEVRYENPEENKRYFYQLNGEGIRNEILCFYKSICNGRNLSRIDRNISVALSGVLEDFYGGNYIEI